MKILSLTEDQFRLMKNQYEDELELALKYVEDIKSILHKLEKQEGKIIKERKPGRKRRTRTRKAVALTSDSGISEAPKKTKRGRKKRGRKPGSVAAKSTSTAVATGNKSKPGRKRGRKPGKAKKALIEIKAKPGRKKRSVAEKPGLKSVKPKTPKSVESKSAVKTVIKTDVGKEEL